MALDFLSERADRDMGAIDVIGTYDTKGEDCASSAGPGFCFGWKVADRRSRQCRKPSRPSLPRGTISTVQLLWAARAAPRLSRPAARLADWHPRGSTAFQIRKDIIVLCHGLQSPSPKMSPYVLARTATCPALYEARSMK